MNNTQNTPNTQDTQNTQNHRTHKPLAKAIGVFCMALNAIMVIGLAILPFIFGGLEASEYDQLTHNYFTVSYWAIIAQLPLIFIIGICNTD